MKKIVVLGIIILSLCVLSETGAYARSATSSARAATNVLDIIVDHGH